MKRVLIGTSVAVVGAGLLTASSASGATLASIAAAAGAIHNTGIAPAGVLFGTVTTTDGTGKQLTPFSGGFDFTQPSPMGLAAGNVRDFHWIHETTGGGAGTPFPAPGVGTKWTFGGAFGSQFILDPSIDHGPTPEEGLETTLWGSADGGATWIKGFMAEVYAMGWSAASIEDQPSSRWAFTSPVSLISATQGFSQGSFTYHDGDTEIDAVSMLIPLPTPLGMGLAGMGLLAFGVRRRPR